MYAGTWGSGKAPIEVQWVELMHAYKWSWRDLMDTPPYIRRICWDMLLARRSAQKSG